MVDTLEGGAIVSAPLGLVGRVVGVLTSPRETYADVAARPSSLAVLLLVLLATIAPVMWILSTEVGQRAALDQQLQAMEAFGRTVSDEQYERMEQMAPYARYFAAAGQTVGFTVIVTAVSGIMFAIFGGLLGGNATFRQVFAVVSFSSVVTALRTLFSTPLNYARESLSSPTTLTALVPFFDDNTFAARLLGSIDLFLIWWILNLAIGLGVLYKRRTAPIATTMLALYAAIALTIAAARSILAGA
jgi:hypothetical protein